MKGYGLIGFPLGHSFSAGYFAEKFEKEGIEDATYRNYPIEDIAAIKDIIRNNPELRGFNITIPHKQSIIPYLDWMDHTSQAIGAVNCVKIENGKLKGYNTDAEGFQGPLQELLGENRPSALVLGTGGASRAVIYVLELLGIERLVVSRSPGPGQFSYDDIREAIPDHKLLINTTPLGTYPNTETCPDINYGEITPGHYLYDLVYNPPETRFLAEGRSRGARTVNGYGMLIRQAERSWEIWQEDKL